MTLSRISAMRVLAAVVLTAAVSAPAVAAPSSTAPAVQQPNSRPQLTVPVKTTTGPVIGFRANDLKWFLGIRYARAPVGNLRWRPPVPPRPWEAPRKATAFRSACAQLPNPGGFSGPSNEEDCLFLNVVTPFRSREDHERLPVMVWIHGGGLTGGDAAHYDPSKLVTEGHIVFVSMNYRLNVFGFFSHPELNNEGHPAGNYGLMDQQLALRWVQDNIAKFGGDPNNVTIFGESSGANSVWGHIGSPSAEGLFHKAIMHSSSGVQGLSTSLQSLEERGTTFASRAGCADAACLRSLSTEQLLEVQAAGAGSTGASPTVDGTIIPLPLQEAVVAGEFNKVPIIHGTNRDEATWILGLAELRTGHVMSATDYENEINTNFGANAPDVFALYPLSDYPTPTNALAAVREESGVPPFIPICGVRRSNQLLASLGVRTYAYEFGDRTAHPTINPVSFPLLAGHTAELQFLFPGYHGASAPSHELTPEQKRLSNVMVRYWTRFARSGSPTGAKAGERSWAPYDPDLDNYQSLNIPEVGTIAPFGPTHHCDFWDNLLEQNM
jgi:para-nitrobenzyl esterase